MEMKRGETIEIRHHACGVDGTLKLNVLLDYFQDAAAAHADTLGIGFDFMQKNHLIWVLSRLCVQIDVMPRLGETLRLMTYPSGIQKCFAVRQYRIETPDGHPMVTATSFWLMIDAETYRPQRPGNWVDFPDTINPDEPRYFPASEKLPPPPEAQSAFSYMVRRGDLDLNRHLNNAVYARLAEDMLGMLDVSDRGLRAFQINFNHAAARNDELKVFGACLPDGNTVFIGGELAADHRLSFEMRGVLA